MFTFSKYGVLEDGVLVDYGNLTINFSVIQLDECRNVVSSLKDNDQLSIQIALTNVSSTDFNLFDAKYFSASDFTCAYKLVASQQEDTYISATTNSSYVENETSYCSFTMQSLHSDVMQCDITMTYTFDFSTVTSFETEVAANLVNDITTMDWKAWILL